MGYKSRKALLSSLNAIKARGLAPSLKLPEKPSGLSSEVYGRKACIYLHFATLDERWAVENELEREGFVVSQTFCRTEGNCATNTPNSSIQVSYFKGDRWDE